MWLLLAQVAPDPISGGAGWVGAGLLGLVLSWLLLMHLPKKDAQISELINLHLLTEKEQRQDYQLALDAQRSSYQNMLESQRVEFRDTLQKMLTHNEAQINVLGEAFKEDLKNIVQATNKVAETMAKKTTRG